jgi:hypothetical protein
MRKPTHFSFFLQTAAFVAGFLLAVAPAATQVPTNVNLSKKLGHDAECAIAQNPTNTNQLFALCNTGSGFGPGLFAALSTDGGRTWIYPDQDKMIADGDDGQAGLAFDRNRASRHFGRLYLVYTDAPASKDPNTNIKLRFSDPPYQTWSAPIPVNDNTTNSKFLPRIASDPLSGNVVVCWHDCRNSADNTAMQEFCTIATPASATPTFMANAQIGAKLSTSNGKTIEFGDYSGLAYFNGIVLPIWADTSNSTGDNPDGTGDFDAYSALVPGGAAAK